MIHTNIQIDGVDKTGKDLILNYVNELSNHKYVIQSRGLISQIAYSKKFKRHYKYSFDDYKNTLFIYLVADPKDLQIRHRLTNEPRIDILSDIELFDNVVNEYSKKYSIFKFNTSIETPYEIALEIIKLAEQKEKQYV